MAVTTRSRLVKAALVGLVVPALAACSAGFDASTDQVYIPARGVNDRAGDVDVLNALVVSAEAGSGTVVATLVNNDLQSEDTLTQVTVGGVPADINTRGGSTDIAANGHNNLATTGAVSAVSPDIEAGRFIDVVFTFERAESVAISVPVVSNTHEYADVPVRQVR